jgi:hypothetical protein
VHFYLSLALQTPGRTIFLLTKKIKRNKQKEEHEARDKRGTEDMGKSDKRERGRDRQERQGTRDKGKRQETRDKTKEAKDKRQEKETIDKRSGDNGL